MLKEYECGRASRRHLIRGLSALALAELTAHQDEVNRQIAADLDAAGIPIVLVDRCFRRFPKRSRYDLVGIDNRRAGHLMTTHLLNAGCRRIAFAFRPGSASTVNARFAGYREALWDEGIDPDPSLVFQSDGTDIAATEKFVETGRPDGIVAANDLTAARLMHSLLKLGVRIPESVRMVGINDVKYASFLPVPLTTLRQPCQQIGAAAMSLMLDRLEKPDTPTRDRLLDCELVVRQSCGSAPNDSSASE